jgi:hypothetical protein
MLGVEDMMPDREGWNSRRWAWVGGTAVAALLSGWASAGPPQQPSVVSAWRHVPMTRPDSSFPGPEIARQRSLDGPTTYTLAPVGENYHNSRIRLTNAGTTDIHDPFVVVNGTKDWFDTPSIVRDAMRGVDRPDGIPYRLWEFLCSFTYHDNTPDPDEEPHDLVRFLHAYGYGICDDHAANLVLLWKGAGYSEARSVNVGDHVVAEVKLDGHWRMMDANLEMIYPSRRTPGLANVEELLADRQLLRKVSGGFGGGYSTTSPIYFQAPSHTTTTMALRLRPGESLERAWYQWGLFHSLLSHVPPQVYGNGRLFFAPSQAQLQTGVSGTTLTGLRVEGAGWTLQDRHQPGGLEIGMAAPYPMVGGMVEIPVRSKRGTSSLRVGLGRVGHPAFPKMKEFVVQEQDQVVRLPLEDLLGPRKHRACYGMTVVIEPRGEAVFGPPRIMVDVQCAPIALPGLDPDTSNTVAVRFRNDGGAGRLLVEHRLTPRGDLVATHIPSVSHPLPESGVWPLWQRSLRTPLEPQVGLLSAVPWLAAWDQLSCAQDPDDAWGEELDIAQFVRDLSTRIAECNEDTPPDGN